MDQQPRRKRLLVVDDDPQMTRLVSILLAREGYEGVTLDSAGEALKRITAEEFDLLLTDWNMPGMTGDQLAMESKRLKPTVPVILMTGVPTFTGAVGIDATLRKPFTSAELKHLVGSFLTSE